MLVRGGVIAMTLLVWLELRQAARRDGRLLSALAWVFGGFAFSLAWYFVLSLHLRFGFLPSVPATVLRESGLVAWVPLAVALLRFLRTLRRQP